MNIFDAAIPGQSLTDPPRNAKWERPPQFADVKEATEFVYDQLMKPTNLKQLFMIMKQGVPVESIVRLILFSGFKEGKWTVDAAMLMAAPLVFIISALAVKAGMKDVNLRVNPNDPQIEEFIKNSVIQRLSAGMKKENKSSPLSTFSGGGLMQPYTNNNGDIQ